MVALCVPITCGIWLEPEVWFLTAWNWICQFLGGLDKRIVDDPERNCYWSLAVVWRTATVPTLSLSLLRMHMAIWDQSTWLLEILDGYLKFWMTTWNLWMCWPGTWVLHLSFAWVQLEHLMCPDVWLEVNLDNRQMLWSLVLPRNCLTIATDCDVLIIFLVTGTKQDRTLMRLIFWILGLSPEVCNTHKANRTLVVRQWSASRILWLINVWFWREIHLCWSFYSTTLDETGTWRTTFGEIWPECQKLLDA